MKSKKTKPNPVGNSTSGEYPAEEKISNGASPVCRSLYVTFVGCLLVIAVGCENTNGKLSLKEEISILRQEKAELTGQIEQSRTEAEQLKKQIQVLSDLPANVRFEHLYNIQKIKITRYTGFYDKDNDGKKEKLIVYIQPIDEQGDIVKATGSVDVQLWDLNKQDGQALLAQWRVEPDELKKLWIATLITINYRLPFDAADKIDKSEGPLTVKVTFTDYLTGKVFNEQKVIEPR
jgi:hypothetical protein